MLFSIVVPTHRFHRLASEGYEERVLSLVASCRSQKLSEEFEILIVTNFSDPDLARRLLALDDPRVRCLSAQGLGVNRARNFGARLSRGSLLFFLDDDCRLPDERFLERLSQAFASTPQVSLMGGSYRHLGTESWMVRGYHRMTTLWLQAGLTGKTYGAGLLGTSNLLGGNLACRRQIFDAGFEFDEAIVSGGDETHFLRKLALNGFELAWQSGPSLEVIHHASSKARDNIRRAWKQGWASGFYRLRSPNARTRRSLIWRTTQKEFARDPLSLAFLATHALTQQAGRLAGRFAESTKKGQVQGPPFRPPRN